MAQPLKLDSDPRPVDVPSTVLPPTTLPGVRGQLPLAPGRPLRLRKEDLTEVERRVLEAAGWQEGQVLPANIAQTLAEATAGGAADAANPDPPLMVSPQTPPLRVDLSRLPPDKQRELQAVIQR